MAFTHKPASQLERLAKQFYAKVSCSCFCRCQSPTLISRQHFAFLEAQPWPDIQPCAGGLLSDPASAFSEAVRARLRDYYHSELVVPSVSAHYAAAVCAHRSYTRALWREDSLAREKERRLKEENG